jgi:hypothetical protein
VCFVSLETLDYRRMESATTSPLAPSPPWRTQDDDNATHPFTPDNDPFWNEFQLSPPRGSSVQPHAYSCYSTPPQTTTASNLPSNYNDSCWSNNNNSPKKPNTLVTRLKLEVAQTLLQTHVAPLVYCETTKQIVEDIETSLQQIKAWNETICQGSLLLTNNSLDHDGGGGSESFNNNTTAAPRETDSCFTGETQVPMQTNDEQQQELQHDAMLASVAKPNDRFENIYPVATLDIASAESWETANRLGKMTLNEQDRLQPSILAARTNNASNAQEKTATTPVTTNDRMFQSVSSGDDPTVESVKTLKQNSRLATNMDRNDCGEITRNDKRTQPNATRNATHYYYYSSNTCRNERAKSTHRVNS